MGYMYYLFVMCVSMEAESEGGRKKTIRFFSELVA